MRTSQKKGGDSMFKKIKNFCKKVATKALAVVGLGTAAVAVSRPAQAAWATSIDLSSVSTDLYTVGGLVLAVVLVTFGFKKVKSMLGY